MKQIRVCGGLIFSLISEIRLVNIRSTRMMVEKTKGKIDNPCDASKLFKYMKKIIGEDFCNDVPPKTVSKYKTCSGQGASKLDSELCKNCFNLGITKYYNVLLDRTNQMIRECLKDTNEDKLLCLKKIHFVLSNSSSLDNAMFYYEKSKNPISKKDFLAINDYDFASFILAVWHATITNIQNNKNGELSFRLLFELDISNQEYFFKDCFINKLSEIIKIHENIVNENICNNEQFEKDISLLFNENSDINIERINPEVTNETNTILCNDINLELERYSNYIKKSNIKYGKLKTILHLQNEVDFYSIYVCNDVKLPDYPNIKERDEPLQQATPKKLLDKYGKFITLSAPGGYGKSMFLKHMLLADFRYSSINNYHSSNLIPIFISLKEFKKNYNSLEEFVFDRISKLDRTLNKDYFIQDLTKGVFLLLFDALDEVDQTLVTEFINMLSDFSDSYCENSIILSSRPSDLSNAISNFKQIELLPFRPEQSKKLITKFSDFGIEKVNYFNHRICKNFTIESIESNPLLLTLKFLIFIEKNEFVKNETHKFYEEAYDVLYRRHDQIHNKFERPFATNLNEDNLLLAITEFCFISYFEFNYSFTRNQIDNIVDSMKTSELLNFNTRQFIEDLCSNLCIIYYDNGKYSFIHRSFQEYFAALYIIKQKATFFDKALINSIDLYNSKRYAKEKAENPDQKNFYFYFTDASELLKMMASMNKSKLEKNIILPFLKELPTGQSKAINILNYIEKYYGNLRYSDGDCETYPTNDIESSILEFINHYLVVKTKDHRNYGPVYPEFIEEKYYRIGKDEYGNPLYENETFLVNDGDDQYWQEMCGANYLANISKLKANINKYADLIQAFVDDYFEEYSKMMEYYFTLEEKYK